MAAGQYPASEQVIVHLSDLHLTGDGRALTGGLEADALLVEALRALTASAVTPSAIVVTGDVTDDGHPDAYARARALLDPVAEEFGATLVWVVGNHDRRAAFRAGLLGLAADDRPADTVHDLAGLRLVVLDTTVPGHHHGELTDDQLDRLAATLAEPAPRGTVLALHHPPLPVVIAPSDDIELRGQDRLASVLAGTDVRAILAGHLHYATASTFAGIPVSVAAACCYTIDPLAPGGHVRGRDGGQALNLVHVYADRIVHTAVPVGPFRTLYDLG
ncbi:MAG: phosphodiesterase [Propionicimonas sp.]|uniref:phosphodiesterase n=1 Tax=Propionicimonas sp. TaxID=1955623 RepID=UPI003D0B04EA